MTARRAPIEVLEALAEAAEEYESEPVAEARDRVIAAIAAYRAATAPLRTRQEVAEQALETLQRYLLISETNEGECSDILAATWTNLEELAGEMTCSEPTRDEPEESHQERHERMNAAGVEKMAAILGKKTRAEWDGEPNATTDHDADLREPEACSCEESEALRKKLSAVFSEVNACAPSIEQQHRIYELSKP